MDRFRPERAEPLSPARRRACVKPIKQKLNISERRAWPVRLARALGPHRSTQRKGPRGRNDEERLTADVIALAREYGRYGYRKITALLRAAGWVVNPKRVERIWRREGLKVPATQPKKGRLWLAGGSCVRLRPEHRNHVWSYDVVEDRTHDGRKVRMLNVVDEFTHECLTIRVARKLKATDVVDVLSDLFILRGVPSHIRSDNGPEFVAQGVRDWISVVDSKTATIEPGSPWENGYVESFNARLRDELLNGEIFTSLKGRDHPRKLETAHQHRPTARLTGLQATRPGGAHPSPCHPAGCATQTRFAGQAPGGATTTTKLTSTRATQWEPIRPPKRRFPGDTWRIEVDLAGFRLKPIR